jgi:hypothetical protein
MFVTGDIQEEKIMKLVKWKQLLKEYV